MDWRRVPKADYHRLIEAARTVGLMAGPESHALRLFDYVQACADSGHAKRPRPRSGVFAARWGCSASAAGRWIKGSIDDIRATAAALRVDASFCVDGERRAGAAQEPSERRAGDESAREEVSVEPAPVDENAAQEPSERRADAAQEPRKRRHARSSETETKTKTKTDKGADAPGLFGVAMDPQPAPKKPDPIEAVNDLWKKYNPKSSGYSGSSAIGRAIDQRVREHGLDAVLSVIRWRHESSHDRARYLRENDYGMDTLTRPKNFQAYAELARGVASPRMTAEERIRADRERDEAAKTRFHPPKPRRVCPPPGE